MLVCFRNRHQGFPWKTITFWSGGWKGDQIFRYHRFLFTVMRKKLLDFTKSLNTYYFGLDGWSSVDWTPSKILSLFSISNLDAVNLFLWKKILFSIYFKIITVIRASALPRVFLMGAKGWGSGFATKGGTGEGSSHSCPKFWTSAFCWMLLLTRNWVLSPFFMPHSVLPLIADDVLQKDISNSF